MKDKIWLSSPHMGGGEQKYINDAFETNWIAPLGPNVDELEHNLSLYLNTISAVVLNSGTAALHLALILLGVTYGDEVLCQSFTFSASANPIIYCGATPIFVDSETTTWNMCPHMLKKAILDRIEKGKKPKAIILVHLYGMPAQMSDIMDIANEYSIPVIEDAAEALGSAYGDQKAGSFGALGVLSFNGNKIITTSGGGALLSNNSTYIETARFLATQARDNAPHYQHSKIGYNYRMSNICAGIGRGQMEVLAERVEQRRANFTYYYQNLNSIQAVSFLTEPKFAYSNRWLTTIIIDRQKGVKSDDVRIALDKDNIECRPLWKPMHLQPVFKNYPSYLNGVSESLFNNGLCLPSGSNLSKDDLNRVISVIRSCFNA
jgi:dTDP-4-amino-4,6-dideoxygalactose transaminase